MPSIAAGLEKAKWGANVKITYGAATVRYRPNGLPNHARQAQYALPNDGVRVPTTRTAHAGTDPTRAQSYDFMIPTTPKKATSSTPELPKCIYHSVLLETKGSTSSSHCLSGKVDASLVSGNRMPRMVGMAGTAASG